MVDAASIWEIDFYSRPLLDERGKRVWELLICNQTATFKYAQYCANTQATTPWVVEQLQAAISAAPVRPTLVRAFRERMETILERSCTRAGLTFKMSRRAFALRDWMALRQRDVYPHESDYTYEPEELAIAIDTERLAPLPLSDALQPDRWAIVTLRVGDLKDAAEWPAEFRELFPVDWSRFDIDTVVPGLLLFSSRARPLAAWMAGVEPVFLKAFGGQQAGLVLEVGINDRRIVARFNDDKTRAEGRGFEDRKIDARGLHFLGIQSDPRSQSFAGFWLLRDID
ncbi:MAG: Tab2/Atab2 family RNA-binding protein [Cyanobacteria bacterium P01_D01_bin.123]